jgi:hypothetical protein
VPTNGVRVAGPANFNFNPRTEGTNMKRNLSLLIAGIVFCLINTTSYAQSENLKLRFQVPFPFVVQNALMPAGEYEISAPAHMVLELKNTKTPASAFEHVQPPSSRKEANGQKRLLFHRYGDQYFLVAVSDGSWQSAYDFRYAKQEKQLADLKPKPRLKIVAVLGDGSITTTDIGGEQR